MNFKSFSLFILKDYSDLLDINIKYTTLNISSFYRTPRFHSPVLKVRTKQFGTQIVFFFFLDNPSWSLQVSEYQTFHVWLPFPSGFESPEFVN